MPRILACCSSPLCVVAMVLFAVTLKPYIVPFTMDLVRSPYDERIGQIPILTDQQLQEAYSNKRVLIVGGTRGVGLGIALAVAQAGADVTIVGRSEASGMKALERLRQVTKGMSNKLSFVEGDLGTVQKANDLVDRLQERVQKTQSDPKGYDFLVVSAAVFPDWDQPHQQEDGIERCFAIATVGRYIIYKNMGRFMKPYDNTTKRHPVRVLNVLASGEMPKYVLSRELAAGQRDPTSLFDSMMTFATGNELMQVIIDEDPNLHLYTTRVSTHPGALKTDLHRGQGVMFDIVEEVSVALIGISIEECGVRQASILASPQLLEGQLSYVSSDMKGRRAHPKLQALSETELPWLKDLLNRLVPR